MNKLILIAMGLFTSIFSFAETSGKDIKIPEEKFVVVESSADGKPAIIVVNTSLRKFKHKELYGWTCSLVIKFKDMAMNGMPTTDESNFVFDYIEELDKTIKGDSIQPNAVYLARITWNGTCEVIWQVKDPKVVHEYLGGIINNKTHPRELDYRIEYDKKWEKVSIYNKIKP